MRAVSTDRRLEAIAGPPLVLVNAPHVEEGVPQGSTVIFAGLWAPAPSNDALGQQTATGLGGAFAYVSRDTPTWGAYNRPIENRLVRIDEGNLFIVTALKTSDASQDTALGRHPALSGFSWAGPMAGAIYDRTLTEAEALAVARSLSLSLSG